MHATRNKKGELIVNDEPMCLTGRAGAQALAELESGASSNPNRDQVLAECRDALKEVRAKRSR
jgi:hypothetical protein